MQDVDFVQHDLHDNDFLAVIISNQDPTFSGRCQVKVLGLMDNIPDEHLPWATPVNSTIFASNGAGSLSVPKVGQFVRVQFNNGDLYAPEYTTIQNIDTDLIQRIKDDYDGTHVLLYDPIEEITIIYQKKSGIQIFYRGSFFQISPDSMITLQTPDLESVIQMENDVTRITTKNEVEIAAASKVSVTADEVQILGNQITKIGAPPYSHAILAESFWALLSTLGSMIDNKFPASPGVAQGIIEAGKQSATSTNVLIGI
ncbi:MAG: phage baseplate assembly protein V [Clostridia bacterium]